MRQSDDQALGKPLRGEMLVVLPGKYDWEVQRTGMAIAVRCTSPLDVDHFATNILGRCPIIKPCVLLTFIFKPFLSEYSNIQILKYFYFFRFYSQ